MKACFFKIIISVLILSHYSTSFAAFHKKIWAKWAVYNPLSTREISHQELDHFLEQSIITNKENINLVNYPHLTKQELHEIHHYINYLSKIDISDYNRNEQLAFWINLYNALIIQIIAKYYPIDSVQEINISPGLFSIGPWSANLVTVNDTKLSLDDILNRIIRPTWNDPRVLYAINDGTIGGANIHKEAFKGPQLEQQLNQVASDYVNSLRAIQIIEGKLIVSKIYDWYIDDFGASTKNLIKHLTLYAKEPLRSQLMKINEVNNYIYNWHLNTSCKLNEPIN